LASPAGGTGPAAPAGGVSGFGGAVSGSAAPVVAGSGDAGGVALGARAFVGRGLVALDVRPVDSGDAGSGGGAAVAGGVAALGGRARVGVAAGLDALARVPGFARERVGAVADLGLAAVPGFGAPTESGAALVRFAAGRLGFGRVAVPVAAAAVRLRCVAVVPLVARPVFVAARPRAVAGVERAAGVPGVLGGD